VLGYLVYKSGYIPTMLGILLVFVSLCYLTQSLGTLLFPNTIGTPGSGSNSEGQPS
jgi:hypothetical protein